MTARPILFSGQMIRALLEGRKTQTRRTVKPRKDRNFGCVMQPGHIAAEVNNGDFQNCPYGQPGDLLWVRETWASGRPDFVGYMADARCGAFIRDGEGNRLWHPHGFIVDSPNYSACFVEPARSWGLSKYGGRWGPSIHMPRWASRLTLRITGVRVQRLQDISEADARAEGIEQCEGGAFDYALQLWSQGMSPRGSFLTLWQSINGADSWDANPYVWVLTFDVIKANVDQVKS